MLFVTRSKWLSILCFSYSIFVLSCFGQEEVVLEDSSIEKITVVGKKAPLKVEPDWVEGIHATISESVYQSAIWFDGFFTQDHIEQEEPKANVRIRLGWEPQEGDIQQFDSRFRISLKLPHLKNKLDLILSDEEADSVTELPLESVKTKTELEEDDFSAAVRFVHRRDSNEVTETRLGISGGDIFLKARYLRRFVWNESHGFKLEPSVFYVLQDGVGSRLLLEYEYQLSQTSQFRINYSIRGSESFSGIKWKHGLYYLQQFSSKKAGALGLVVEGEKNSDHSFITDRYTLNYRYRFNASKKWLFFEIEPFLEFPEKDNYEVSPGIALRVEGYFYKI